MNKTNKLPRRQLSQPGEKEKVTDAGFRWEGQGALDKAWQDYLNRASFSYDPTGDPMYRRYEDRQIQLGRLAMEDTQGVASALTGGYANSYGQVAGQQVYQDHLRKLGDVLPTLYDRAYDRYRAEGEALYDEVVLRQQQRKQAYEEYQAQLDHRSRQEQEAYDRQQDAYKKLTELIAGGYNPTEEELTQVGMTRGQADALLAHRLPATAGSGYSGGGVSAGNIKTMQRAINDQLGLKLAVDGLWGSQSAGAVGGLSAQQAWKAYRDGTLFDGKVEEKPVLEQQVNWGHIDKELEILTENGASAIDRRRVLDVALKKGKITVTQYNQLYVKWCK